jgi:hypothetical protein
VLLSIVPAMDAIHYQTMLLVDRARLTGMFRYAGLEQHFWQPFEIAYRLRRAGFRKVKKGRVRLDWDQFACASDMRQHPPPWDWFFRAEV